MRFASRRSATRPAPRRTARCRETDGPLVRVDAIQNGGALLTAEGEKQVSVPQGATVAVGPYQVTTVRIDGASIEFEVAGPG